MSTFISSRYLAMMLVFLFASISSERATAAEIEVIPGEDFSAIVISGKIEQGDEDKFAQIAIETENGVVLLSSPGGALLPALEIGKLIQIRGFGTYVPKGYECVSACALIWVAGEKRLLSATGAVGFHASYRDNAGRLEEAGVANALVGRYLTLLNLSERAIVFATSASPHEVSWLRSADVVSSAIPFEIFDFKPEGSTETRSSTAPPLASSTAPPPIRTQQTRPPIAKWYYAITSQSGSLFFVRGQDVMSGHSRSTSAEMWVQTDDSGNSNVTHRSSMSRYFVNCVARTYWQTNLVLYDKDGRILERYDQPTSSSPIIPESVFESVTDLVCSDEGPGSDERDIR